MMTTGEIRAPGDGLGRAERLAMALRRAALVKHLSVPGGPDHLGGMMVETDAETAIAMTDDLAELGADGSKTVLERMLTRPESSVRQAAQAALDTLRTRP